MAGVAQKIVYTLRDDVNKKLSILPLRYYDSTTTGEVLSRAVSDLDNINKSLQNNLTQIITSIITVIGVLAMMLSINLTMTAVSVAVVPASALIALLIAGRSKRAERSYRGDVHRSQHHQDFLDGEKCNQRI